MAAQARLQVYSECLYSQLALNPLSDPFIPSHQGPVSQALPTQQAQNLLPYPSMYTSHSAPSHVITPPALLLMQQAPSTQAPVTQTFSSLHKASNDLVIAETIMANRVPIPEPEVFKGDPLRYSLEDCTLI